MAEDRTLARLTQWADERDDVRAAILTSTRAMPNATLDPFSDYDIIYAMRDVTPYFADRAWLNHFGDVLAVYRDPIRIEHGFKRFAYITQYDADFLKIDFTLMEAGLLATIAAQDHLPDDLDVGYRVLLDKDGLTDALKPPTHRAFMPQPPSESDYLEQIEVFFHEATYVAKNLWRDELLPAKYSFDTVMKGRKLRTMLEWHMGIVTGWTVKTGSLGKGLKRHTPPDWWADLEATYVGADINDNWHALFKLIDLYSRAAQSVGAALGFAYPQAMETRMRAYLQRVRQERSNR